MYRQSYEGRGDQPRSMERRGKSLGTRLGGNSVLSLERTISKKNLNTF